MARRSEDWNVGLAKDLRDAAFAREFLLASIDGGTEGVPVRMATAIQAQEAIRTNQALYERKLDEGKYVNAMTTSFSNIEGTFAASTGELWPATRVK